MSAAKNEQFEVNGQVLAHRRWQVCATSLGPLRSPLRDQSQLKVLYSYPCRIEGVADVLAESVDITFDFNL